MKTLVDLHRLEYRDSTPEDCAEEEDRAEEEDHAEGEDHSEEEDQGDGRRKLSLERECELASRLGKRSIADIATLQNEIEKQKKKQKKKKLLEEHEQH